VKKLGSIIIILSILTLSLISNACGGGSSLENTSITSPTAAITETATPTPTGLPEVAPGTLCLFFTATTRVQTSTIEAPGDFTEYEYGVFRYVPSLEQLTQITELYTFTGHNAKEYPYTTAGRLFTIWRALSYDDKIWEIDLVNGEKKQGNSGDYGGLAVIGDSLYYIRNGLGNFEDFCVDTVGSQASPREVFCQGCQIQYNSQHAVGNKLIRVNYADGGGYDIIRFDPNTGKSEAYISRGWDESKYYRPIFFEDQGGLYAALEAKGDDEITIYRLPVDFRLWIDFQIIAVLTEEGSLKGADADDGHIVLHLLEGDTNKFVIYNRITDSTENFWLPNTPDCHNVEYMQVLIAR
jgi:hypothetical protein